MNKKQYDNRVWEVSSLIKLVATYDIEAICGVARNINKYLGIENIDSLNNEIIYSAYCNYGKEPVKNFLSPDMILANRGI